MVSWWAGEGDGGDEVGDNPATLHNGTSFSPAEVGQGFSFDGVDGFISIPPSTTLNVGAGGGFTIEGWIQPTDLSQQHAIVEWNNAAGRIGVHLYISVAGHGDVGSIYGNIVDTAGFDHQIASSSYILTTSTFQHIAMTYDKAGGTAKLFCNGSPVATATLGTITPQTTYGLYLGGRPSGAYAGNYFQGLMDEVSLYGRALDDYEIATIYYAGIAGKCKAAPTILSGPPNQTARAGADVALSVRTTGSGLQYQWQLNGFAIDGATNRILFLSSVTTNEAGAYSVVVSNQYGSAVSKEAILTIDNTCISAAAGLVSWWPAEADSADHYGMNPGTLHGGVTFVPGESGQAFHLDGTNGYVSIDASPSLDVGAGDGFTLEGWICPKNVSSQHAIAEWDNGSGGIGAHLWFSVPGQGGPGSLYANLRDLNGWDHALFSAQNLVTTNFQHVALTYTKTNGLAKLYRNGVAVASKTLGSVRVQTSFPLNLGARVSSFGASSLYAGVLDEFALYKRALSDAEIADVYNAGSAGKMCIPPEVLSGPASQRVRAGTNVSFSPQIRGTQPLSYQWFKNGLSIAGATNASLTFSNVQPSNGGNYSLRITNALGFATSSNANLKIDVVLAFGNASPLTNSSAVFGGSVTLQLQNVYTNGYIFYTLDGTTPTFASPQYTGPFPVSQSVILRALGYSTDFFESGELDPIFILMPPRYTLTASTAGGGTISLNPSGNSYISNTTVTITATPAPGWSFLQWLGDATGNNASTNLVVNRNKSVQAVFGTSLNTTAAGGGSVSLNPPGGIYPYGTVVWLSAIPQPGNSFAIWGNAASGSANPLSFTLTHPNPTVSSLFAPVSGGQAGLTVVPVGNGRVSVNPRANAYTIGANVTLTATPDANQSFLNWSGDAGGSQNPLSVTMNQSKTIYAHFTHKPSLSIKAPHEGFQPEGFVLTLSGDFGARYRIDTSSNLLDWTVLGTGTSAHGSIQFADPGATNVPRRFYRAVLEP